MLQHVLDIGTITFWSEDEIMGLIREKDPDFPFDVQRRYRFRLQEEYVKGWGILFNMYYNDIQCAELLFTAIFEVWEDRPSLQHLFDETTQSYKYRLRIENRGQAIDNMLFQAPMDVNVRPAGYNARAKLAWEYVHVDATHLELRIYEVRPEGKVGLCRLPIATLSPPENLWQLKPPIVIVKHKTYFTVSPSINLKRTLWYQNRVTDRGVMSDAETAWISPDISRGAIVPQAWST
jgi:hypothetical protein